MLWRFEFGIARTLAERMRHAETAKVRSVTAARLKPSRYVVSKTY